MRRSQSKLFPGPGVGGWEINLFVGEGGGRSGYLVHVILLFESNKIFPEGSSPTPSISALAKAQAQRLIYNRIKKIPSRSYKKL